MLEARKKYGLLRAGTPGGFMSHGAIIRSGLRPKIRENFSNSQFPFLCIKKPQFFDALSGQFPHPLAAAKNNTPDWPLIRANRALSYKNISWGSLSNHFWRRVRQKWHFAK